MPNSYFQFKEFTIEQSLCANKVSTDACMFGALVAQIVEKNTTVLDIGCGSGILSLMLAQAGAMVTGVEIEQTCATQATENVYNSKFAKQIKIINQDIKTFKTEMEFDLIISNPPFFNNTYQSLNKEKNIARQTETLGAEDWTAIVKNNSTNKTQIALLLSYNDVFETYKKVLLEVDFSFQKIIKLYDKKNAPCKRVVLLASKTNNLPAISTSYVYKNKDNTYTSAFTALLKNYYLHL